MRRGQPASGQSSPQGSLQVSAASKPTLNHPTRLLSCTQGGSQGPQPNTTLGSSHLLPEGSIQHPGPAVLWAHLSFCTPRWTWCPGARQ